MLYKIVGFTAHYSLRIAYHRGPVFLPGKTCQEIDLTVSKHPVQVAEIAIDIFILPAGILRKLTVVFVGVAALNLTLPLRLFQLKSISTAICSV